MELLCLTSTGTGQELNLLLALFKSNVTAVLWGCKGPVYQLRGHRSTELPLHVLFLRTIPSRLEDCLGCLLRSKGKQ